MIDELIMDEQEAIEKYQQFLLTLEREKKGIEKILEEEKSHHKHLKALKQLLG